MPNNFEQEDKIQEILLENKKSEILMTIKEVVLKISKVLNFFTTPATLSALTFMMGVSSLKIENIKACNATPEFLEARVLNNSNITNIFGLELISKEVLISILSENPRFGTLFWGRIPFDYKNSTLLVGENITKIQSLIYTNEFFSEGSGIRSIADFGGTILEESDSVGIGQINPLYLLDTNILERVEILIENQDKYPYLGYFLSKIKTLKAAVTEIKRLEQEKFLLEKKDKKRAEDLKKIEKLEKEINASKEEAAQYLRNYLGKTFDVKCSGVNQYQPLNQLFSLALNESHFKMAENFLESIGIDKKQKIFADLSAFMTIISYKQGPNYAREIMTHNIVIALQEEFGQDLSFQKNISDKKRKLYSSSVLGRKKREDRLVTGLENISEVMVSWQENPPEENSELYPLYKKLEKILDKNPDFLHEIEKKLKHLRNVINNSDKNLGKAKDEKDGDDIIKVFRYVYNQEGKLVQKYPEFEELVNLLGEHITLNPEMLESMLTIKGLKNSNSKNPIYVGNYFLHALLNYKKAEKKYAKKRIHDAVAKVVNSRFTK